MPVSFGQIRRGQTYTQGDLASMWGYAGTEALSRGVVTPRDDNKIVLFVTLAKRPGDEQYEDELVGDILLWEGPNDHFAEDRMLAQAQSTDEIHLFCRVLQRDAFAYAGQFLLYCCQRFTDRPSRFVFRRRRGVE